MFKEKVYKINGLYHSSKNKVSRKHLSVIARTKFGARMKAKKQLKQFDNIILYINKPIKKEMNKNDN